MSIMNDLESPKFKVTKSDRVIIDYLKENIEVFCEKTISEIAKEMNVGEATITRFTRKIGFNGLQDFRVNLTKEFSISKNRNIIDSTIRNDEPVKETAYKLLDANINTLEGTVELLDNEKIENAVNILLKAKKIHFIGIGYSGIIAQDSNYKFMRIGINTTAYDSGHTMIMMASIMKEEEVIIAISHSGETGEIIRTVEVAKKNNIKVIGITGNSDSKLGELADVCILYKSGETLLETGAISTKLAQMFLIDIIYTEIVKMKYSEAIEIKTKTTEAIKLLKKNAAL